MKRTQVFNAAEQKMFLMIHKNFVAALSFVFKMVDSKIEFGIAVG